MERKRWTKILVKADKQEVAALSAPILSKYSPVILKEPCRSLAMIKMREPVRQSVFYIGEVIVCEAAVEIEGTRGTAVLMDGDEEKTLDMAIIDAAFKKGVFQDTDRLLALEKEQNELAMRENAMHAKTIVQFKSMDQEAPHDLNAHKKASV